MTEFKVDLSDTTTVDAFEPRIIETFLFVPAHEQKKAVRAMASDAGAVIFDLEASVPDAQKQIGRDAIREYVRSLRTENSPDVWVRVNASGPHLSADLAGVDWREVAGAVLAQAEDPATLLKLQAAGAQRLMPLIESVAGFDQVEPLGAIPGVERFGIGTWDLALDLGLLAIADPDESELIWRLRGDLILASCRLGLQPPVDGVYARLNDEAGLRAVCERAHRLGYGGKLLIHPQQIAVARSVFGRNDTDLGLAHEIVQAYDEAVRAGLGAIQVRGRMIDGPVVARAHALLTRWRGAQRVD